MRTPLKTHGGKHYLAAKILPLLPPHRVYVEPFAGGLSVLLRKPWAPVEVAGDLDQELINFYHVLCAQTTNLIDRAKPLAYSREVLAWAKEPGNPADRLDAALRFLVRRRFSRGGLGRDFAWSTRLRGGQPGDQNAWETAKAELSRIAERLRGVQFVCQNAIQTIRQFDGPGTLTYLDPPYPASVRSAKKCYEHEMSLDQHAWLLHTTTRVQGAVAISSYANPLYDRWLATWDRHEFPMPNHAGQGCSKARRVEVLWIKVATV